MGSNIPSLSTAGWIASVGQKAEYVLGCFITSEFSQSTLFFGNITSLPHLIKEYGKDIDELTLKTKEQLTNIFSRYFDSNVTVNVKIDPIEDNESQLKIRFSAWVIEDGVEYNVARTIEYLDGTFRRVAETYNTGQIPV